MDYVGEEIKRIYCIEWIKEINEKLKKAPTSINFWVIINISLIKDIVLSSSLRCFRSLNF